MFSFKSVYFVVFTLVLWGTLAEISDKRLCVDQSCSEPVSYAKTLRRYRSIEEHILSFAPNEDVTIFSHGAGKRPELIGVEIKGIRGYANKEFIKETLNIRRPKILVDTELKGPREDAASVIEADPTREPFEIVDGTKIPIDLATASTEIPIPVNINRQSDQNPTKPLESVPDNQNNIKPNEQTGSVNQNKIQKTALPDNPEEDDADDEADNEDDDEDDVDDEQEETDEDTHEGKVEEAIIEKRSLNENLPSDSHGNGNSSADIEAIGNVKTETEYKETVPIENIGVQTVEGIKPIDKPENSTRIEQSKIAEVEVTENITQPYLNSTESTKVELEVVESKTDVPVLSEPNVISVETSSEASANAFSTQPMPYEDEMVDSKENNEPSLAKLNQNPLNSQNEEQTLTASHDLPANLQLEFKDLVETEKPPLKESASVGVFDGLGTLFPLFNTADVQDDVISSSSTEELTSTLNEDQTVSSKDTVTLKENNEPSLAKVNQNPLDSKNEEQTLLTSSSNHELPANLQSEFNDVVETEKSPLDEFNKKDALEPAQHNDLFFDGERTDIINHKPLSNIDNIEDPGNAYSETEKEESGSFFSGIASIFGVGSDNKENNMVSDESIKPFVEDLDILKAAQVNEEENPGEHVPLSSDAVSNQVVETMENCEGESERCPQIAKQGFCDKEIEDCPQEESAPYREGKFSRSISLEELQEMVIEAFNSDMFLYLFTTSISVLVLIFVWILVEKCRREAPLIARINKLEQQLLATLKENEMLQEKTTSYVEEKTQLVVETVPNEIVNELNAKLAEMVQVKATLEEQIQALEKELDTSTEVGIELNKIISEMLNSTDASEILKENVEQMQKRLLEQQDTINSLNESSNLKSTENYELRLELEISNKKVEDLQREVDKMVEKILKIEEERDQQHKILESEIAVHKNRFKEAHTQQHSLQTEIMALNKQVVELQRIADTKVKEYDMLKETLKSLKSFKDEKGALKPFLEVSEIKAQLEQMKSENFKYSEQLSKERETNLSYNTQIQSLLQEVKELQDKYQKADKEKVETITKLEVLNNYFKEKEDQMQKEISKYESLWIVKEGEATSTTEQIRYMQEELQNYKTQNESLKQEIVNQEVELKSQISMLEKKSHESWVTNRQTERKLEEARQEAALLRNRLTMKERAVPTGNNQIRIQSPLHQNGELPISPPSIIDPTQSPPPFFNPRDHITKSPPIPGMPPPPFLPPPLGSTFMPPPPLEGIMPSPLGDMGGMPPFIPGFHPGMFPGDRRPPPLGRMSSPPPVGGRYSPESTVYSEYDRYDRRSPSPPYDSEYGASPPPIRGYSPYDDRDRDRARLRDDRREYKRSQARSNGRSSKGIHSSESENDSLGKTNKKPQRKV